MERRFQQREQEALAECKLDPRVFNGMLTRLGKFLVPFAEQLVAPAQRQHTRTYIEGLLSSLPRKSAEMIAYQHDQDRKNLQHFLGVSGWDHRPLLRELARQVGREIGRADGVIVFDPSAFSKQGKKSVGVARQWCGRMGKVDNCQVGVYMGYVSSEEHALVDVRLYLPEEWTKDRKRCREAGVPKQVRFRTRHQLALEMLGEHGACLPHAWVAGDDEMGRVGHFRRDLQVLDEQYFLAVPCNTTIRDWDEAPAYGRNGRRLKPCSQSVRAWSEALPESAWTTIHVRDGEKGPLQVEIAVGRRVEAKTDHRWLGYQETLVVVRSTGADGTQKYDYHLSNGSLCTSPAEFARVWCAMHRIEECIKRGKSEAGLAEYQVRTWNGWHHHQTLSLIAAWFLVQETRRGKKIHTGAYPSGGAALRDLAAGEGLRLPHVRAIPPLPGPHHPPQHTGKSPSLQST